MANLTCHLALPFLRDAAGERVAGEPTECPNPVAAVRRAEALSYVSGNVGAIAFSRTGDPNVGQLGDAIVLRKFGDVPVDLSGL